MGSCSRVLNRGVAYSCQFSQPLAAFNQPPPSTWNLSSGGSYPAARIGPLFCSSCFPLPAFAFSASIWQVLYCVLDIIIQFHLHTNLWIRHLEMRSPEELNCLPWGDTRKTRQRQDLNMGLSDSHSQVFSHFARLLPRSSLNSSLFCLTVCSCKPLFCPHLFC